MLSPSPTPRIDPELKALRAGETSTACRTIVERYGPLVKATCFRVLCDQGLAEDAAQETFLLLMRKARSLSLEISLAGWLYHAAYRTALNHRRAARRRRMRETSAAALYALAHAPQPNLWAEIEPHLDEAMASLPERQRTLVVQCYFQNQSQRSAAAALNCSESLVSRELSAAIETLRRFFAKRRVVVTSAALTGVLPANASSAVLAGSAEIATAMTTNAVTATTLTAALVESKLLLATAALAGTTMVAFVGHHAAPPRAGGQQIVNVQGLTTPADAPKAPGGAARQENGKASFQFTNAMAFVEQKKAVLLEADPDARYARLQAMGLRLSRAGFDALIAQGMDASVAPWRNTFDVLANHTEAFDHYVMAWSNEDPLAALNWVTSQPDGASGLRKQLLYVLTTKQFTPDALGTWITGLPTASMKHEATLALEAMQNPSAPIAHMNTGDNEGFLVDLALLQGERLDWSAFGRKLAAGRSVIVARVMRNVLDKGVSSSQHLDVLIRELAFSPDANIRVGAVTILRAAQGDPSIDYRQALEIVVRCDQAGMSDFRSSVFKGWAAADPQDAIRYASGLKDLAWLRDVIRGLTSLPAEATFASWLASAPETAHDIAWASLYGRTTSDPFAQLEAIIQSSQIIDQVAAAQEVMRYIPLAETRAAAEWLKQLPADNDRRDIGMVLIKRLSAVDPQAALELVEKENVRGMDYESSVAHLVTEFAAQNDLAQSAQFIQQITDPKVHSVALGQLAMVKFPGRPQEAYAFLQAHSCGDWQSAALRMLTDNFYNKLGNIDANAAEILKLDLPRLGPEVAARANVLCKVWLDNRAPLAVPLAWTQQMPEAAGRDTRLLLAKNNGLKPDTLREYQTWARTASLNGEERARLLKVLSERLKHPGTK